MDRRTREPGDLTIDTYGVIADDFARRYRTRSPELLAWLDGFAARVGAGGTVLEIGSGPGADADHLERSGLHVQRTDATPAFVELMRARGVTARRLDVRTDALGGPYDAVLGGAGWAVESLEHVAGPADDWLHVFARRPAERG